MAGLMELWDVAPEQLEGEVNQSLPAGKYVLRFLRATDKVKPLREDPSKEGREIYINFGVVRPIEAQEGFNAAKYENLLLSFRDSDAAQLIRFMKTGGWSANSGLGVKAYLASQTGRQYVADVTYTAGKPDAQGNTRQFTNIRGLVPLDVYEERMNRFAPPTSGGADELE